MKISGLQSRLDDNRSHEEMLIAKFNLLNKSIEDIKLGNELSKGIIYFLFINLSIYLIFITFQFIYQFIYIYLEKTTLAEKIAEVNKLKNEIKTLNNQV